MLTYFAGEALLPGQAPTSLPLLPKLLCPGENNSYNIIKHDTNLAMILRLGITLLAMIMPAPSNDNDNEINNDNTDYKSKAN